jgi:tetratricopeptide (TPR) repeat protein
VLAGKLSGQGIDTPSEALSEILTAFAADLARTRQAVPPVGLVQVARYANPQNVGATTLLALLLDNQGRTDEALALARSVPRDNVLATAARDVEVKILTDSKRLNEAFATASAAASTPGAMIDDYSRLGGVYDAMKRYNEAAATYGRAIALAQSQNLKSQLWPLLLVQANSFEQAGRWPETKAALQQALAISPDQPLLLNFMGYAKLEHHEDLDAAEAMIRRASELAPDDASITDSLGWAQFKRGKLNEAIGTLQKAAEKDPDQPDIQEHLGDALYKSGRRMEARFAWNAALVTAEDEVATRVKAKLASGLTPANAAP